MLPSLLATLFLATLWLLATASPALAGVPQGASQGSFFQNADRSARVFASEVYTPLNTPSTVWQCLGIGGGAGYHAPLVFGRASSWRAEQKGLVWLPASPASRSHGCDNWSAPSCYDSAYGSGYHSGYAPAAEPMIHQPVAQQFYSQQNFQSGPTPVLYSPRATTFSPPPTPQQHTSQQRAKIQPKSPPVPRRPVEPISPSDGNEPESLPMPSI